MRKSNLLLIILMMTFLSSSFVAQEIPVVNYADSIKKYVLKQKVIQYRDSLYLLTENFLILQSEINTHKDSITFLRNNIKEINRQLAICSQTLDSLVNENSYLRAKKAEMQSKIGELRSEMNLKSDLLEEHIKKLEEKEELFREKEQLYQEAIQNSKIDKVKLEGKLAVKETDRKSTRLNSSHYS